jgi:2-dehydro-3-deoxyphosphogluconate aldolase / (4S)-4-hydroxy-2-oxoglutarate aldolase
MRTLTEIDSWIVQHGLVAVIRTPRAELVLPVCEALVAGGILSLEITLTVPNALSLLRETAARFGPQAVVGAGTVLTVADCQAAMAAGAEFVVSPISRLGLVKAAHDAGRPVMLGAYTPTEAQLAFDAGADFIKIFPADKLGPSYIKSLRGPLPHLRIVPTGGVDLQSAGDFLKAGCVALGVGSSLLTGPILKEQNWPELTALARQYVRAVETARGLAAQPRA